MNLAVLLAQQPSIKQAEDQLRFAYMIGIVLFVVVVVLAAFFIIRGAVRSALKSERGSASKPQVKPKHHGVVVKSMNFPDSK